MRPSAHVRFAEPSDARAISKLYVRTYTPSGGGDAREYYPFPQIMGEENVIELMTGGAVVWVVAETPDGTIAGSAAAVRNIGGPKERIAEIFGVAVEQTCRRQGVGSALLQRLRTELASIAEFVLCEARTAEAGGWKAARNAGFQPIGFEPYAHAMPVGYESMVLTAWSKWSESARPGQMSAAQNTKAALKLADAAWPTARIIPRASQPGRAWRLPTDAVIADVLNVRRDDHAGPAWFSGPPDTCDRKSSLVELHPFQGVEPRFQRFEHAFYVASDDASDVAAARVQYDRTDARARILGIRTMTEGIEPQLLAGIVEGLTQLSGHGPLVIILYVLAGNPATQLALEGMGFFPTAYFPGMISAASDRTDVIQYTRLSQRSWSESVRSVTALEWPEARRLIDQVLQFNVDPPPTSAI